MSEFSINPFQHVQGEMNDIEKAQFKRDRAEQRKATEPTKRKKSLTQKIVLGGAALAIGLGAKEVVDNASVPSPERQTAGRESIAPQAKAMAEGEQAINAANELGGDPYLPYEKEIDEQLAQEGGTLERPE